MTFDPSQPASTVTDRAFRRQDTYTYIRLQPYGLLPFLKTDAILINISWTGLCLEFINKYYDLPTGRVVAISIPLSQVGIFKPKSLKIELKVGWADKSTSRVGGEIRPIGGESKKLLKTVIQRLAVKRE